MKSFNDYLQTSGEYGQVELVRYPIVTVTGLPGVKIDELVIFETGQLGQAFMIQRDYVEILLLSKEHIKAETKVTRTNEFFTVPVGEALLGGIIDPLGNSISKEYKPQEFTERRPVDISPAGIDKRTKIKKTFHTGVMVVDTMIPLGYGQKELVIGDRKTGKTAFLQTIIKYQAKTHGTIAVYCAIGKKKSDIKKMEEFFQAEGIADKTVIVATSSNDSPSLIFMTPYSAMSIAEYFRDQGRDVLIILDDLSTHAKFYREISLLAKRFPGRDSYPGDIFYVHSRLLERTGNFKVAVSTPSSVTTVSSNLPPHPSPLPDPISDVVSPSPQSSSTLVKQAVSLRSDPIGRGSSMEVKAEYKDASITGLPVVEIVEGDLTGYISSNIMSMTDGHIFFDSDIYYEGRRPAINIPLSVTRVGKQVHSDVLKAINRELSTMFVLFDRMQNLSHFGAELSDAVQHVLETGQIFYKFFTQPYTVPIPVEVLLALIAIIWLKYYDENNIDCIYSYRDNLVRAYQDPKNKAFFEPLPKSINFNDLLLKVSKQRDVVMDLCEPKPVPNKPVMPVPKPAPAVGK